MASKRPPIMPLVHTVLEDLTLRPWRPHRKLNGDSGPDVRTRIEQVQPAAQAHWIATDEGRERYARSVVSCVVDHLQLPEESYIAKTIFHTTTRLISITPALWFVPSADDIAGMTIDEELAYLRLVELRAAFLADPEKYEDRWFRETTNTFAFALSGLPEITRNATPAMSVPMLTAPLMSTIANPGEVLDELFNHWLSAAAENDDALPYMYAEVQMALRDNLYVQSGYNPKEPLPKEPKVMLPSQHKNADPSILAEGYFDKTPFAAFLTSSVHLPLADRVRFEHTHICGGTGHGKTQLIQSLIKADLDRVADGTASIVVIDSQGDLIRNISRLAVFADGGKLAGKLVFIDPEDVEYPIALNMFDVNMERINTYSQLDRERMLNGIIELYDFVFEGLLGAELTSKQTTLFRYLTRLMLHIPNATIHTLRQLLDPRCYEQFEQHIASLHGTARAFFETEFAKPRGEYYSTKEQLLRRIWGVLENQTFERMFSHPKNKLDLYSELNKGRVILISTSKDLLKQSGSEIVGRFFIAQLSMAAQERARLPESERMPTIAYIDEAADYLDQNTELILREARKYKVGLVLAHQYLGQLDPKLQQAFAANTAIKFAGGTSARDARTLSQDMRCESDFITEQPKGHFAVFAKGVTQQATPHRVKFLQLEKMERMDDAQFDVLRQQMRERYAVHYLDVQHIISEKLTDESAPDGVVDDAGSTDASRDWPG